MIIWTPCVFYSPEVAEPILGKIASKSLERLLGSGRWEAMHLEAGAKIIGVNARDLHTFEVDRDKTINERNVLIVVENS